jgi:ribosomal protein S17
MAKTLNELTVGDEVGIRSGSPMNKTTFIGTVTKITATRQITVEVQEPHRKFTRRFNGRGTEIGGDSYRQAWLMPDAAAAKKQVALAAASQRTAIALLQVTTAAKTIQPHDRITPAEAIAQLDALEVAVAKARAAIGAIPTE